MNNLGLKIYVSCVLLCLVVLAFAAGSASAQDRAAATDTVDVISTRSGVLPGYRITVSPSGQIASTLQPRYREKAIVRKDQMTPSNREQFFRDLSKASPLGSLPVGPARRIAGVRRGRRGQNRPPRPTASLPGPQIYVLYHGQHTPNLRVVGSGTGKALYQDVKKIMQVLRLPIPDYP